MGYTNYWTRTPELAVAAFSAAVADLKTIMRKLNIRLGGCDGTGKPVFRADMIEFNGRKPRDYETFAVERVVTARDGEPMIFEFCKTRQEPYDLAVQVALITLKQHLGATISVSSDGGDEDWQRAREACMKWLGYGEDFKLEK
jgi:hypothetical protein